MSGLPSAPVRLSLAGITRIARPLWNRLPERLTRTRAALAFGRFMHRHHVRYQDRHQSHVTRFLRNLPQLNLLCVLLNDGATEALAVASVGCSTGAELYSALWLLQARFPTREVRGVGVDISPWAVDVAREARYPQRTKRAGTDLPAEASGLTAAQCNGLFREDDGQWLVRERVRAACTWSVGDVRDAETVAALGQYDVVMANNFLGPMRDAEAIACLQGLMPMVKPGRYLVVEGIDLDVKCAVLGHAGWRAVTDDLERIYFADYWKRGWPWIRWGHEPIDRTHADWRVRYATIFQAPISDVDSTQRGTTVVSAAPSSPQSPGAASSRSHRIAAGAVDPAGGSARTSGSHRRDAGSST
jgi:chemotaxis methyl-accepting protein methylase